MCHHPYFLERLWCSYAGLSRDLAMHLRAFPLAAPLLKNALFLDPLAGSFLIQFTVQKSSPWSNVSDHSGTPSVTSYYITLSYILYST